MLAPARPAGRDKHAQGCAGEGLKPKELSPRLRARLLAVTCDMSLLESIILDRLHLYIVTTHADRARYLHIILIIYP